MPSTPVSSTVGGFVDVKESDYFADAVQWAVEKNITSGTSKTTFGPDSTCTRGQEEIQKTLERIIPPK